MKIFTVAEIPDELAQAWLQHLRDFDTAHPGCHFQVFADAPNVSVGDMVAAFNVEPKLTFQQIFDRELAKMEVMRKSLRRFGIKIGKDD
jgi:hypothetical protein